MDGGPVPGVEGLSLHFFFFWPSDNMQLLSDGRDTFSVLYL